MASKLLSMISSTSEQDIDAIQRTVKHFHEAIRSNFLNTSITPTIHLVICHGPAVMRFLGNRTRHLSKEAKERTNKILRTVRLNPTRKICLLPVIENLSH